MGLIDELKGREADKQPVSLPTYPRAALAELFYDLGFTKGVEIGTLSGRFAQVLLEANPELTLWCVDPWKPYPDLIGNKENFDDAESEARRRLASYNAHLLKMTSMQAIEQFEDNELDFVYIDGAHDFINVALDLRYWSDKVRSGGIIAGHDFVRTRHQVGHHVAEVVSAWTAAQKIAPWFILGACSDGLEVDKWRSYFWVKP